MLNKYGKVYITGEIGINGNGDLDLTKKLIRKAAAAGFDCIKFQKRDLDSTYTQEELDSPRMSAWGTTFREQKAGLEYTEDEYDLIDDYCLEYGIEWSASPWDLKSIDFLMKYDLPYLKIPSAKATDKEYLKYISQTQLPLFLSTGMCDMQKTCNILDYIKDCGGNLSCVYHCTATYPSEPHELNLKVIPDLYSILKIPYPDAVVGFSGHERGITTSVLAVVLGAKAIERHITLDRALPGSDQAASLEPKGFETLVRDIRDAEVALGDGLKVVQQSEIPIIKKLRKVDDFLA